LQNLFTENPRVGGSINARRTRNRQRAVSTAHEKFSYGVSDRGASIRIPIYTIEHGWKGYLEDRRSASNADPYRVTARIMKTYAEAHANALK